jgi:protein-disulfide isomerase
MDIVSSRHRWITDSRCKANADSAGSSGVAGTPTSFVSGRRQYGDYDIDTSPRQLRRQRLS